MGEYCKLYWNKVRETDTAILLTNIQALYTCIKLHINYLITILLLFLPPPSASPPIQVCISVQIPFPKDGTKVYTLFIFETPCPCCSFFGGVETSKQNNFLTNQRIDFMQEYLCSIRRGNKWYDEYLCSIWQGNKWFVNYSIT